MVRPLLFVPAFLLAVAGFGSAQAQSNEDFLTIQLKDGPVVIQLMPDVAPKHVAQIKDLAAKGDIVITKGKADEEMIA